MNVQEKAFGAEHQELAFTLDMLGQLHFESAKYSRAETFIRRSLAIYKKASQVNHKGMARNLGMLGVIYYTQGKYDEAEALFRQALVIYEADASAGSSELFGIRGNLATVCYVQGKYVEAELLYREVMTDWEKSLKEVADFSRVASGYARLLRKTNREGEAAKIESVLELMKQTTSKVQKQSKGQTQTNKKKIGRNELCPCGSSRKFKRCCGS